MWRWSEGQEWACRKRRMVIQIDRTFSADDVDGIIDSAVTGTIRQVVANVLDALMPDVLLVQFQSADYGRRVALLFLLAEM